MSWIEGIGDEVTITFAVLAILFVITVAWLSTGIRDIPFIRVVVVQLTRRRRQNVIDSGDRDPLVQRSDNETEVGLQRDGVLEPVAPAEENVENVENVNDRTNTDCSAPKSDEVLDSESTTNENVTETSDNSNEVENVASSETIVPPTPTELRQRRLDFYNDASQTSSGSSNKSYDLFKQRTLQADNKPSKDLPKGPEEGSPHPTSLSERTTNLSVESDISQSERVVPLQAGVDRESQSSDSHVAAGQANEGETDAEIRVRLKYLNDTQRLVKTSPSETIGNFRRKHFPDELSESKLVRFIFNGQDLRNDNSTLQACNIIDNSVVHCLITQPREQPTHSRNQEDDGLFDVGIFMFPLFGLLLGIVWYLRFMYRQFFNVTSTLTLGGITFLYLAAFMSSLRGRRPHQHLE